MILERRHQYKGYIKVDELTVKTQSGETVQREVAVKNSAVAALVYNTLTQKYLFVKQWRPGAEAFITELPAGVMDKENEPAEECVKRELLEEIGYKADTIQHLFSGYVSPGWVTELMHVFYVEVSQKVAAGGGLASEHEELELIELTRTQMLQFNFNDLKTISAVQWAAANT